MSETDFVTPEMYGAGNGGNDTQAFINMFNFANANSKAVIACGVYHLDATKDGIPVETNVDMSLATIHCQTHEGLPAGEIYNASKVIFSFPQDFVAVNVTQSALVKGGQTLAGGALGLKGYLQFDSSDTYVYRNDANGLATQQAIAKCETNIIDADGRLNWPIYMGFAQAKDFQLRYKAFLHRLTFRAPSFNTYGAQFKALISVRRCNVTLEMGGLLALGQIYTALLIEQCANTIVNNQINLQRLEKDTYYLNYFMLIERHANLQVNGSLQQSGVGGIDGNYSRGTLLRGGCYYSFGGHAAIADFTAQQVRWLHHAHISGWGEFQVLDCTHVLHEAGYRASIEIRPDYGSSFDGRILIRNLTVQISSLATEYKLINCARVKHTLGMLASDPDIEVDGIFIDAQRSPQSANFIVALVDYDAGGDGGKTPAFLASKQLPRRISLRNIYVRCNVPVVLRPIVQSADYSLLGAQQMATITRGGQPIRVEVSKVVAESYYRYGNSATDGNAAWLASWKFGQARTKQIFHLSDTHFLTVCHRTPYDTTIIYDRCVLPGTLAVADWFEEPQQDVTSSDVTVRYSQVISPTVGRNGAVCAVPVSYLQCRFSHNSEYSGVLPTTNTYIGGAVANQVKQFQGCVIDNPHNAFERVDGTFQLNVEKNYVNNKFYLNRNL
ncbi:hypothetical protein [Gibbsiella quercinecans]|uniref:hypothetical protein n=1 Tax=Gibbsiella quercinecans TaxID=929813 RepID=UPI003A4DCFC8